MKTEDYHHVSDLKKAGYVRATNTAPVLRAYGFDVVLGRVQTSYHDGGTRWRTKKVPWAPEYAVNLVKKLRKLGLNSAVRKDVLTEALQLGRAGPLAEAAHVAGKMMENSGGSN